MSSNAAALAHRLAEQAEAVCRHYLPGGKRRGRYWIAGDVTGISGRSLYVRLTGADYGPGAAGKWSDAATGEHGDLLDLIAANRQLKALRDVLAEARSFLRLPRPDPLPGLRAPAPQGSIEAANRLFAISRPLPGTLAERYLRGRAITLASNLAALRFHPRCYYRPAEGVTETWPALVAAVTDVTGAVTGLQRTWLDLSGTGKAPIETPRRAMGLLLGNAVRFGNASHLLVAGEGVETVLSLKCAFPSVPMAAALSANHLAAMLFPPTLRILYIARDADIAGDGAVASLSGRARTEGIVTHILSPRRGDFNDDLRAIGITGLRDLLCPQIPDTDMPAFLGELLETSL